MCLKPDSSGIQIAQEDITTYKRVKKGASFWIPIIGASMRQTFAYNKIITALDGRNNPIGHLKIVKFPGDWSDDTAGHINEGFHSSIKEDTLKQLPPNVICVIPKDTEYCYGSRDDVVSVQLIVFKHIWNYLWYKLRHR